MRPLGVVITQEQWDEFESLQCRMRRLERFLEAECLDLCARQSEVAYPAEDGAIHAIRALRKQVKAGRG